MTPRVALVGYPNAGKSTLFELLTGTHAEKNIFPFTTVKPQVAEWGMLDPYLDQLNELVQPERLTRALFLLHDIPGLIEGASNGAGLGNQFLSFIRPAHFLIFVVRNFKRDDVPSEIGIAPAKELALVRTEILLSDLKVVEKALSKTTKQARFNKAFQEKAEALERARADLSEGRIPDYHGSEPELLSTKPFCVVVNGDPPSESFSEPLFSLDCQLFLELQELSPQERGAFQETEELLAWQKSLQSLILEKLNLSLFYTVTGGREVKSYFVPKGATLGEAAGLVHTDIQKGFIKAHYAPVDLFLSRGGFEGVKKEGLLQTGSRETIVPDRAVIHFSFR